MMVQAPARSRPTRGLSRPGRRWRQTRRSLSARQGCAHEAVSMTTASGKGGKVGRAGVGMAGRARASSGAARRRPGFSKAGPAARPSWGRRRPSPQTATSSGAGRARGQSLSACPNGVQSVSACLNRGLTWCPHPLCAAPAGSVRAVRDGCRGCGPGAVGPRTVRGPRL